MISKDFQKTNQKNTNIRLSGLKDRIDPYLALAWGAGRFSATAMVQVFALLVLYYLVTIVGLDPKLAGAMVFAARMFDVVVSPAIGLFSDRLHSRWGRRRPFLIIGGIFGSCASLMIFNVPHFQAHIITIAFVETALLLYTLAYATINIPHMAIVNEMSLDSRQRVSLMSYGVVFMTLGGLAAGAVCPFLVQSFGDGQSGYSAMSIFLGVTIFFSMVLCFAGLRRAPFVSAHEARVSLLSSLKEFTKNRPAMILLTSRLIVMVLVAGQTSGIIFFTRSILKLPVSSLSIATLGSTLGQFAAVPGWLWLARRFGNLRVLLLANLLGACVGLSWVFAQTGESIIVYGLRYTAFGIMSSGYMMLVLAMITDVVEYDQIISGRRREGVYNSLFSFVEKSAAAVGVLLTGLLLSYGGFNNTLKPDQDQPANAILALYISVGAMPMAGFFLSFLILAKFYRLDPGQLDIARVNVRSTAINPANEQTVAGETAL